jgi:Flp pilus assembly protein TadD
MLLASLVLLTFILTLSTAAQKRPQRDTQARRTTQPTGDSTKLLQEAAQLLQAGQLDAAEPLVRGALQAAPQNADAHNLLGVILDQRGKFPEAEHAYRTTLRLSPQDISPRANLGVLLARTGRQEEAVSTFEAVLRAAPDHLQATINLGLLYAARPQLQTSRRITPSRQRTTAQHFRHPLSTGKLLL